MAVLWLNHKLDETSINYAALYYVFHYHTCKDTTAINKQMTAQFLKPKDIRPLAVRSSAIIYFWILFLSIHVYQIVDILGKYIPPRIFIWKDVYSLPQILSTLLRVVDTCMSQWTALYIIQVMACHLFIAKPTPKLVSVFTKWILMDN